MVYLRQSNMIRLRFLNKDSLIKYKPTNMSSMDADSDVIGVMCLEVDGTLSLG